MQYSKINRKRNSIVYVLSLLIGCCLLVGCQREEFPEVEYIEEDESKKIILNYIPPQYIDIDKIKGVRKRCSVKSLKKNIESLMVKI